MNPDRAKALVSSYVDVLYKECLEIDAPVRQSVGTPLSVGHLAWMCEEMLRHLAAKDTDWGKFNRWLGWVQCGMYANLIRELDQLRDDVRGCL